MPINGAGILPQAYFHNESYFLLANERIFPFTKGTWGDFGGSRDPGEFVSLTAAREAHEESKGVLGSILGLRWRILWCNEYIQHRKYVAYVLPYSTAEAKEIPTQFTQSKLNGGVYSEISRIQWVKSEMIYRAVIATKSGAGQCVKLSNGKALAGRLVGVIRRSKGYQTYLNALQNTIYFRYRTILNGEGVPSAGVVKVIKLENGKAISVLQQGSTLEELKLEKRSSWPLNPNMGIIKKLCWKWMRLVESKNVSAVEKQIIWTILQNQPLSARVKHFVLNQIIILMGARFSRFESAV